MVFYQPGVETENFMIQPFKTVSLKEKERVREGVKFGGSVFHTTIRTFQQ